MKSNMLDRFYDACGALAGVALASIAVIILLQTSARWLGVSAQGLSEWAGYMMAASSFLAFAHTLRRGGHIRVMLILQRLRGSARRTAEILAHAVGVFLTGFLAVYAVKFVYVSWKFGEISEGSDAMPLWIPRLAMALGSIALFVAMTHSFVEILRGAEIVDHDDAARTE
ncbi:MAG: TRAP transporter small permease [Rhizobiales bacterium]|nr:TRAP transporter small permease [Hyphomicrobiales bacterium]